jgi:hypothetical protein
LALLRKLKGEQYDGQWPDFEARIFRPGKTDICHLF